MVRYCLPRYVALAALTVLMVPGCGGSKNPIRGEVVNGDQPVKMGSVRFIPDLDQGNDGPTVSVPIRDGKFSSEDAENDISPGPNTVRVEIAKEGDEAVSDFYELEVSIPEGGQEDLVLDVSKGKRVQ